MSRWKRAWVEAIDDQISPTPWRRQPNKEAATRRSHHSNSSEASHAHSYPVWARQSKIASGFALPLRLKDLHRRLKLKQHWIGLAS
jgi:hypothetical protein